MQDVPYGFCHCGCGERTPLANVTRTERGYRKGEPQKYIRGHNGNKPQRRYEVRDCGHEPPCWVWMLSIDRGGYGHVKVRGVTTLAHRLYYEQSVGVVPQGLELDHLCRNRACVNPEHLEPVTPAENVRRRIDISLTSTTAGEIKSLVGAGWAQADIARAYGVSQQLVCDIKKGRAWTSV
jgi:hypothetical protein